MAKKIIGYTELRWICPHCQNNNAGNEESCVGCGAPQPDDVVFIQPVQQVLITEQEKIEKAKSGADIHCGFCGTRNSADLKVCSKCGSDLMAGKKREQGTIVGAFSQETVGKNWICESCQNDNLAIHTHCTKCGAPRRIEIPPTTPAPLTPSVSSIGKRNWRSCLIPGLILIAFAIIMIFVISLLSKTEDVSGFVSGVEWKRNVKVESFGPVNRSDWRDEIPSAGDIGLCEMRFYRTQDQPAPQATEVCGTPYTVDLGNGNAEVVQDCSYQVYAEYCQYTIDDWQLSHALESSGSDLNPQWPDTILATNQRLGEESEIFYVQFNTSDGVYQFSTTDINPFTQFIPGSEWLLKINAFNQISSVEPAR